MSKFNIGDKVKSTFYGYTGTVVGVSDEVVYMRRDDGMPSFGDGIWSALATSLTLIEPAADEALPPAPKSVLYTEDYGKVYNLRAAVAVDCISILVGTEGGPKNAIVLEPDVVLQLCHDLRRMAMQIKREQKQGE